MIKVQDFNLVIKKVILLFTPNILLILYRFIKIRVGFILKRQSNSYDDIVLTNNVVSKTLKVIDELNVKQETPFFDFVFLSALFENLKRNNDINVLDFGGGSGYTYFYFRKALGSRLKSWTVIETDQMVKSSMTLQDEILNFHTDIDETILKTRYNLVIASASIPYVEDPLELLHKLIKLDAEFMLITRNPLSPGLNTIKFRQISDLKSNGPGNLISGKNKYFAYNITILSRTEFEKVLSDSYEFLSVFNLGNVTYPAPKRNHTIPHFLHFLKKKS